MDTEKAAAIAEIATLFLIAFCVALALVVVNHS